MEIALCTVSKKSVDFITLVPDSSILKLPQPKSSEINTIKKQRSKFSKVFVADCPKFSGAKRFTMPCKRGDS